jgi:hypothetical protein
MRQRVSRLIGRYFSDRQSLAKGSKNGSALWFLGGDDQIVILTVPDHLLNWARENDAAFRCNALVERRLCRTVAMNEEFLRGGEHMSLLGSRTSTSVTFVGVSHTEAIAYFPLGIEP